MVIHRARQLPPSLVLGLCLGLGGALLVGCKDVELRKAVDRTEQAAASTGTEVRALRDQVGALALEIKTLRDELGAARTQLEGLLTPRGTPAAGHSSRISVQTTPSGATATLDGKVVGVTPLMLDLQAGSRLTLRLDKVGFRPHVVEVDAGAPTDLQVTLQRAP